jgi:hypothetical protein
MNQVRMLLEGMYLLGLCANPRASNCGVTANTVVEPLESGALSLQVPEDLPNLALLHSCIVPDELRYCNPFDVSRNVYNRHPTSLAKCPDDPHSSGIRNFRVSGSVPSMEERRTKYSVCRVLVYGVSFVMPSSENTQSNDRQHQWKILVAERCAFVKRDTQREHRHDNVLPKLP